MVSDRIRVLHINTAKTWRGGEQQVLYLVRSLAKRDVLQLVICEPGSPLEKKCIEHNIPCAGVRFRFEADPVAVHQIGTLAKKFHANLIQAHTAKAHAIALLVKRGIPWRVGLIVSRRVDFPAKRNFFSRLKYFSPLVDRYLAISDNVKRVLVEDGIDPKKIRIAVSGVDVDRFRKLPNFRPLHDELFGKEDRLRSDRFIIGNVAALEEHKDHRTLLDAIALVKKTAKIKRPVSLLIVGDGSLRSQLVEHAEKLDLLADRSVVFCGFRTDIDRFFSLFDLFVLSSTEEGLGTSVLDAMASGLAVCATRAGGIPEMIVETKGGLLATPGDAKALAQNIARLIRDPALCKKMGQFNKKRVKLFSYEATCDSTLEVYRELLTDATA